MRLIFLGSPEPVLAPLKTLIETAPAHGHQLVGVVSQPARPVGRHQQLQDPPVAALAKSHGLPVLQPQKASDPDFLDAFRRLEPDVAITAAYGQILPPEFLKIPRRATINIHPSLLPRYRGATPVPAALLAGETLSGVTILFTVQRLDAGAVILQESSPIGADETAEELTRRYFELGARMLMPALAKLADPAFTGVPQNEAEVTFCRKIQKTDGNVDWLRSAEEIHHAFRAHDPWPGTYTFLGERRLTLTRLRSEPGQLTAQKPGEAVLDKRHGSLAVGTGEGTLHILELKPAGGKAVQATAFWNGLKDRSHVVFTSHGT